MRSRDIDAIFAASAGRPGLRVMFFAFIAQRSNSGSTPRLADCGKRGLEGFHNGQHEGGRQEHRWRLVEPAVPDVGAGVSVAREIQKQLAAVDVIGERQGDDDEFGVKPGSGKAITPQPGAENGSIQPQAS
jgi:hypothetical protein